MKNWIAALIAISILDVPGQPNKVLLWADCDDGHVIRLIVKRKDLEKPSTLDTFESILKSEHCGQSQTETR